jgi:protoporphyrinogen oxidase
MVAGGVLCVVSCSGLAAAYRLRKSGVNVTVFEAADRAGGKIRTNSEAGFLWDEGANTMVSAFRVVLTICGPRLW